jgi:hypothetical protein
MRHIKYIWHSDERSTNELTQYTAAIRQAERDEALDEAAKIAENACLVPPDGGCPSPDEVRVAYSARDQIRNLKSQPSSETGGERE